MNIIGLFTHWNTLGLVMSVLYSGLGVFIIVEVFQYLRKADQNKKESTDQIINQEHPPTLEQKKRGVADYILPAFYIIAAVLVYMELNLPNVGVEGVFIFIQMIGLGLILPLVIIAFMGKYKIVFNSIAGIVLFLSFVISWVFLG